MPGKSMTKGFLMSFVLHELCLMVIPLSTLSKPTVIPKEGEQ